MRRHPYAKYTRETITERRIELRTQREQGPRGSRILPANRSARAMRSEVKNTARAKWRKFDFCMSRVTNSYQWM